jgi:DNA-binding NarL/FixJ family response regulator
LSQTEKRIVMLIVDDHELMRRMLREYLQSAYANAVVMEAGDGAGGLELCRSQRPHLVLMDVGLPDANGIELTAQVKKILPETAVVVVSQHATQAYVERARAAGAFAYVSKDTVHRELLPTVRLALHSTPTLSGGADSQMKNATEHSSARPVRINDNE